MRAAKLSDNGSHSWNDSGNICATKICICCIWYISQRYSDKSINKKDSVEKFNSINAMFEALFPWIHHRRYWLLTSPSIEGFIRGFLSLHWVDRWDLFPWSQHLWVVPPPCLADGADLLPRHLHFTTDCRITPPSYPQLLNSLQHLCFHHQSLRPRPTKYGFWR